MQKRAILLAFFSLFFIHSIQAAEGQLDSSFGSQGLVLSDFHDEYPAQWQGISEATSLTLAKDGKILVGGSAKYFFFAPPNENLPPDSMDEAKEVFETFGMGGDFAIIRYLPGGTIDKSFGGNGKIVTDFKPHIPSATISMDTIQKVAVQSDGKVLALGNLFGVVGKTLESRLGMSRYLPNGSLDKQFNATSILPGTFAFDPEAHFDAGVSTLIFAYDVALDSKGRIMVAAGGFGKIQGLFNVTSLLIRLMPDGSLDTSFNPNGVQPGVLNEVVQLFNGPPGAELASISLPQSLLLEGNDIYVFGSYLPSSKVSIQTDLYLEKLHENGQKASDFGDQGVMYFPDADGKNEIAHQIYRLPNAHFLALSMKASQVSLLDLSAEGSVENMLLQTLNHLNPPSGSTESTVFIQKRFSNAYNECSDRLLLAYTIEGKDEVGKPYSDVGVARWKRDGSYDADYNPGASELGTQVIDFKSGSLERAREIALQGDGKLLIAATTDADDGKEKFALLRLQGKDTCQLEPPITPPTEEAPSEVPAEEQPEQALPAVTPGSIPDTLQGGGGCTCSFGDPVQGPKIGVLAVFCIYIVTYLFLRKMKRGIAKN